MSYCVKISEENAYPDVIKQYTGDKVPDQPRYPALDPMEYHTDSLCFWVLHPSIHASIQRSYTIRFSKPNWLIDFDDPKSAMMFKLAWGGV